MNGLLIGRFQPFHLGHLDAVLFGLSRTENLFIGIGSSNKSNDSFIRDDILGENYLRINSPLGKVNKILDDDSDENLQKIHLMGMEWWTEFGEKTLEFIEE